MLANAGHSAKKDGCFPEIEGLLGSTSAFIRINDSPDNRVADDIG